MKWYRGYSKGDISKDRTTNRGFKLEEFRFRREIGRKVLVDEWNRLSNDIVSAQTMGSFKRRLDKFMGEDDK